MNVHDATETAYRNGYEQGKKDAVKHGHWEQQTEPLGWQDVDCAVCSVCGNSVVLTDSDMDIDDIRNWWNYCLNCGAKMDG